MKKELGRVKFGVPKAENVEVSLLRHVTACNPADRYGGYVNSVSFVRRQWEGAFYSETLEGAN
jgi:hypothetical protein